MNPRPMFLQFTSILTVGFFSLCFGANAARASAAPTGAKVEVLHWWTSGSEAQALQVLKKAFEARGGQWIDVPIAGGGGDAAGSVLRSRFAAGNPPSVVMMHLGPQVWEWAQEKALLDLQGVADTQKWSSILPPVIAKNSQFEGRAVSVPINAHRLNSLFASASVLKKLSISLPKTWDEFNLAAEKMKSAGLIPLAHGGQPWQDVQLFDSVAIGILGLELYKQALVEHQAKALAHPKWIQVFEQMRKLKGFTDPASAGRDWNLATALVMKGQAGFQIMGDWAKGEFTSAKQVPGRDFLCSPTPGSGEVFLATTDSFGFFKGKNSNESGQKLFAEVALDPKVQMEFNLKKGSTPVRLGVASTGYDACGAGNIRDFAQASKKGTLAMGFHSSNPPAIAGAITDLVTQHFNSAMSASEAAQRLAKVIRSAQ